MRVTSNYGLLIFFAPFLMTMRIGAVQFICLFLLCLSFLFTNVNAEDNKEDGLEPTVIILFMFFGLGLGIIVMQVLSVFGEAVPYTVVVFVLGVIFSAAADKKGAFGESISQWVSIDAELVLFVFLPPLVFGEAMNLNWYHVKNAFNQSLLLAGPGVVFSALVMGAITKVMLPYDWGWNLSMTFGAILSATDTVAMVALLKGANASAKLTILIVGESLLNDGTAMAMFTIFFNALNGKRYTVGSIISFFVSTALGSMALGITFGLITVRWLRSANRPLKETDVTIQVAITICCAYLVFFCAQYSLEISGVIACVGAGVVLAWLGPPIILSHETMHNVWGMMEWVLNTLIFLLAGLIIGHRVLGHVRPIDWLYCILLYIILMALRFLMVAMLYPWISTIGHKCTKKEAIFMSWAGLRGALGMTLALQVEKGGPSDIESETSRLFFFVGGIAALTLLINATTAQQLLIWLGLLGDAPEKTIVMTQIKKKLRRKMDKIVDQMAKEFDFTVDDLDEVRNSCTLLSDVSLSPDGQYYEEPHFDIDQLVDAAGASDSNSQLTPNSPVHIDDGSGFNDDDDDSEDRRRSKRRSRVSRAGSHVTFHSQSTKTRTRSRSRAQSFAARNHSHASYFRAAQISGLLSMSSRGPNPVLMHELLGHVRAIFLEIVKVRYWNHIEGGKLPRLSHSAQFLLYSIEVGLDQTKELMGAKDWSCIEEELTHTPVHVKFLTFLENVLPFWCSVSHTLGHLEAVREKRAVYMLTSFIEAHQHAQRKIHAFIGNEDDDEDTPQSPEEIRVIAESTEAVAKAQQHLAAMSPDTITAIRSKQAARLVLAKEAEMVKNMMQEGLITNNHAEEFLEEIGEDTARIEKERNRMYREQASNRGRMRLAQKLEEEEGRRSLLNRDSMF